MLQSYGILLECIQVGAYSFSIEFYSSLLLRIVSWWVSGAGDLKKEEWRGRDAGTGGVWR
jgi:hypothetical protein